jgi:hypothetical protein
MHERLREELYKYAVVSAYLFVCFSALLLYKSAILRELGQHFLPVGIAAVKALVLGKFLLIGEAVRAGERIPVNSLLQRILVRTVLLFLALVVLTIVEEAIVGLVHGRSMAEALSEFFGNALPEKLAGSFVVLLALLPLVATFEINKVLGPGVLRRILLERSQESRATR